MELVTLNSSFQEDTLVGKYQSLIWTERYASAGDFQITSSNVKELKDLLPLESYVSLRDSVVPMKVETHKIEKGKTKAPLLTITGRSCEACWLELRASTRALVTGTGTTHPQWLEPGGREADAAYTVMRQVLGDTSRYSYQYGTYVLYTQLPANPLDVIPELDLTLPADFRVVPWDAGVDYKPGESVIVGTTFYLATSLQPNVGKNPVSNPTYWTATSAATAMSTVSAFKHEIKNQNLYTTVMELLATNNRGLKATRPGATILDFPVRIEIYNGRNLTDTVSFDARFDQIDDATYLLSNLGSTNVAYVLGKDGDSEVNKTMATPPSGLNRRVLVVDETTASEVSTPISRRSRGLVELYKNNATALFGGEVAIQVANEFNKSYFLGDIIKLVGEYGLSQNVRVAEFIRSEDASGEKAYPTFEAIS